ncbi:MAG TPA: biotin-dependent carboxyltransferase family protein [Pyrinomonadaceae bacterium]|nr:biotin-dependent carboxyltransferase family protein [Pyrinomonadaceae bacterium]
MSLLINKTGILTTIQDLGRTNFARFGINPNGAMDQTAARLINVLLANDENEAVLEMHYPAPEIIFEKSAIFAIGGADLGATLDGKPLENWRIYYAESGNVLKFTARNFGNRVYLSIKNGFKIQKVLNSASTNLTANFGGFEGRTLRKGDRIFFTDESQTAPKRTNFKISNSLIPFYSRFPTVRVTMGAEFEDLKPASKRLFQEQTFRITRKSNRMGYRLDGEPLLLKTPRELVSSAVNFGTIQLLPDGNIIVLMADHQTTGGYPRLANIIKTDIPLAAQLGANDKIGFHLISLEDAESLLIQFENEFKLLKIGAKFQNG